MLKMNHRHVVLLGAMMVGALFGPAKALYAEGSQSEQKQKERYSR